MAETILYCIVPCNHTVLHRAMHTYCTASCHAHILHYIVPCTHTVLLRPVHTLHPHLA